ncbi:MAG: trehalose-6-phosphate synthase [Candidatus Dormibacteraeota bacterium]|nr:trehalose-6-phosphate synthase [Candidatus Dormibacteraeota bacterium]
MSEAFPPSGPGSLRDYTTRMLRPWSPIVVSNRAPLEPGPRGGFRRGAGGLVTALMAVAESTEATWVACARTPEERRRAADGRPILAEGSGGPITMHLAVPGAEAYRRHYSVIANPLLWFLQHYLWGLITDPVIDDRIWRAWAGGYVAVNRLLADRVLAVAAESARPPLILTQDYQLYLVPKMVREGLPQATFQQFIHIPWPAPNYWKVLPKAMRDAIFEGLLGNDVVGFQSRQDVRNFLMTCEELAGLRVDHRERAVLHEGRVVWVRSYPISIDVEALIQAADAPAVERELEGLGRRPEKLIVRVDRTDPSKNVVRGFLAYELLLRRHPELAGRVRFHAFLQPSRQDIGYYSSYLEAITGTARRINAQFGRGDWEPIRLELAENMRRALALYRDFDVMLVNPIYDGMNLVAKEGMLVNRRGGALVLSENAGAHEELGEFAFTVNPFDVGTTADVLWTALQAPEEDRRRRLESIRHQVRDFDLARWLSLQVRDLRELAPSPTGPAD